MIDFCGTNLKKSKICNTWDCGKKLEVLALATLSLFLTGKEILHLLVSSAARPAVVETTSFGPRLV